MITDLPTDAASVDQRSDTLLNHPGLKGDIVGYALAALVGLAEVVGRRSDHQAHTAVGNMAQQFKAISFM